MSRFFLHGLVIETPVPIPGLVAAPPGSMPDVAIIWTERRTLDPLPGVWTEVPIQHSNGSARFLELWRREDGNHLVRFRGATISDFALPPGYRRIEIQHNPSVADETLLGLALGPVLGVLLRLRGALALHAGGVATTRAAMVAGPSGAGKSTLVLALCQAGCRLLADDMAVVQTAGGPPRVEVGHQGMRLWTDSLVRSGGDADAWPFAPYTRKRAVTLEMRHETVASSVPLAAIFLLGPRQADIGENRLVRQRPSVAMMTLSTELYPPFLPLDRASIAPLFDQLSRLVAIVPVYGVARPDNFDSVPDLCARILDEIN
jgi:hypothetical protein